MRFELRILREFLRLGHAFEDSIEDALDVHPGLCRNGDDLFTFASEEVHHLFTHAFDISTREVDLIEYWDDREIILYREVDVRECLCLDPLARIDDEDRSLD